MKVILKQDVKGIGKADDVVNVNPGYARNFLFPRNLAVEADEGHMKDLKKKHDIADAKSEKMLAEAKALGTKLSAATITIRAKAGTTGTKLYGSITSHEIADAVKKQTGLDVDKRKINLADPIKIAGSHTVSVKLHKDVTCDIKLEVVAE